MERRNFLSTASTLIGGVLVSPFKVKPQEPKGKISVVGIGTWGCEMAKKISRQHPYLINYYGINSLNYKGKMNGCANIWFQTRYTERLINSYADYNYIFNKDWEYNIYKRYFKEQLNVISGRVIMLAALGNREASWITPALIPELQKDNNIQSIEVIATIPFNFESNVYKDLFLWDHIKQIKDTGAKTTFLDKKKIFKGRNVSWAQHSEEIDTIVADTLNEKILA